MKKKGRKPEELLRKIKETPINYLSDLFMLAMVISWITILIVMVLMGIYSTIILRDNTIWGNVESLAGIPLTAGGAIWMVKNSVQHAIAISKGNAAADDFPDIEEQ